MSVFESFEGWVLNPNNPKELLANFKMAAFETGTDQLFIEDDPILQIMPLTTTQVYGIFNSLNPLGRGEVASSQYTPHDFKVLGNAIDLHSKAERKFFSRHL